MKQNTGMWSDKSDIIMPEISASVDPYGTLSPSDFESVGHAGPYGTLSPSDSESVGRVGPYGTLSPSDSESVGPVGPYAVPIWLWICWPAWDAVPVWLWIHWPCWPIWDVDPVWLWICWPCWPVWDAIPVWIWLCWPVWDAVPIRLWLCWPCGPWWEAVHTVPSRPCWPRGPCWDVIPVWLGFWWAGGTGWEAVSVWSWRPIVSICSSCWWDVIGRSCVWTPGGLILVSGTDCLASKDTVITQLPADGPVVDVDVVDLDLCRPQSKFVVFCPSEFWWQPTNTF